MGQAKDQNYFFVTEDFYENSSSLAGVQEKVRGASFDFAFLSYAKLSNRWLNINI